MSGACLEGANASLGVEFNPTSAGTGERGNTGKMEVDVSRRGDFRSERASHTYLGKVNKAEGTVRVNVLNQDYLYCV